MPGRNQQRSGYRFGFQRQETDPEYWSGAVSYKYRVADARLGRFFSVDPLVAEYPWNSPYAFSENSTIAFVELEGLEKLYYNQGGTLSHQEELMTVQYYVEDPDGEYCSQGCNYNRGFDPTPI
ncbi:MAG: RHS repeat-associated core domain-containing protein, partial [Bacteroidia bacterium]